MSERQADLRKSWEITTRHLQRARLLFEQLPRDAVAQFESLLQHNELECAMRVLEDRAWEQPNLSAFWLALADAAENMQLFDEAREYRTISENQVSG